MDLQQAVLWAVQREMGTCNESEAAAETPTLSLRASAPWHHGPVGRRRASEGHICKRKSTCVWKVGVSNWEEVTRFKCNNTDFLFIHMCLSHGKGLCEGQHVLPSVYQLTELHLFAILLSINLGKNAKHMGLLVGSSSWWVWFTMQYLCHLVRAQPSPGLDSSFCSPWCERRVCKVNSQILRHAIFFLQLLLKLHFTSQWLGF